VSLQSQRKNQATQVDSRNVTSYYSENDQTATPCPFSMAAHLGGPNDLCACGSHPLLSTPWQVQSWSGTVDSQGHAESRL